MGPVRRRSQRGKVRRTRSTTGKQLTSFAEEEESRERASPEETSDQLDGPLRLAPRSFREELGLTPQAVTSIGDPTPYPEERPISAPVNIRAPSSFKKLEGAKNYGSALRYGSSPAQFSQLRSSRKRNKGGLPAEQTCTVRYNFRDLGEPFLVDTRRRF